MSFYCGEKYVSDEVFGDRNIIKAIDRFSGEPVALKRWADGNPDAQKEISVWKDVYPEVYKNTCKEASYIYLVRSWVEGISLDRYRSARAALPAEEALRLFRKIISAAEIFYRHAYAVHGDIKPENIIVTENNSVVFIDFETAEKMQDRAVPKDGGFESAKTLHFASRAYSAPEAYHGALTVRSDIYSLGMLFLFLMTGSPKREKMAGMPDSFAAFCRKCTEPEQAMRYQSLEEVKAATELLWESLSGVQEKTENKETEKHVISVENMSVTARTVQYAFSPEIPAGEPVSGSGSETEPAETGKIVLFPKNMQGYRRVILYVPGNAAFASELAYMSARLFGLKTGLFEIDDYDSSVLEYYLTVNPARKDTGLINIGPVSGDSVMQAAENAAGSYTENMGEETGFFRNHFSERVSEDTPFRQLLSENIDYWETAGLIAPCADNPDLFISLCDVTSELELSPAGVTDFAVWCYSHFDITVIADLSKLKPAQSISLMRYSDYLMIPIKAEADRIKTEKHFYRHFLKQYAVPRAKIRYVGWEYDEKCCADHAAMVSMLGENIYLGTVGYDMDRNVYKNIKGESYCTAAKPWLKAQYSHIIRRFLFDGLKSA